MGGATERAEAGYQKEFRRSAVVSAICNCRQNNWRGGIWRNNSGNYDLVLDFRISAI